MSFTDLRIGRQTAHREAIRGHVRTSQAKSVPDRQASAAMQTAEVRHHVVWLRGLFSIEHVLEEESEHFLRYIGTGSIRMPRARVASEPRVAAAVHDPM